MSDYNATYSDISARFKDWMSDQANDGNTVADVALDTINRAQDNLARYRPWSELMKTASLTLAGAVASLPADYGRMVSVYSDTDGDGKPDTYYFNEGEYDTGYQIRDAFTKAAGHVLTITFYSTPSSNPYVDYIMALTAFAGTGTEYSFFPGDLVLVEAQYLHIVGSGLVGNEYTAIVNHRNELLRDYEHAHQFTNVDVRIRHNDMYGNKVLNESYDLGGGNETTTNRHAMDEDDGTI